MSKLNYEKIEAASNLIVDLDENKKPIMKALNAKVTIFNPSDASKAQLLANKAAKSGFILNSVKTQCSFEIKIV